MKQEKLAKDAKEQGQMRKKKQAEDIGNTLNTTSQRAMSLAQEKGAPAWLATLPIEEHGFAIHKSDFRDALALRYGWRPKATPITCIHVCGKPNNVDHALSCPKGGYVIMRHNKVIGITARLLEEVAKCIEKEPVLQPLDDERMSMCIQSTPVLMADWT